LRLSVAAVSGSAISVLIVLLMFGLRPDFSLTSGPILLKGAYGLLAAAAAVPFLLEVSRPSTSVRRGLWPIAVFAGLNILIGLFVLAATLPDLRVSAWTGDQFPECLYRILAIPVAVALTFAVRGLGATRLTLAGSAIGGVSGSLAAIVYASCCPADSVLYVVSWYLAAVLFCAAIGAAVLSKALKW
jgi:hypothetical protein